MRAWIAIAALFLGLFLLGCTQPASPSLQPQINVTIPQPEPPATQPQNKTGSGPCSQFENVLSSDSCFLNLSISSKDPSYCEKIYSISSRDECYGHFSRADEKFCAKISGSKMRSDCYYSAAKRLNDTDYCVKISDTGKKRECLKELSPPCSFEQGKQPKELCLAFYHNDSSYCSSDSCLFSLASKKSNIRACDAIDPSKKAMKYACRAAVLNDSSKCGESGLDVVTDYCYQLAATAANNSYWCTLTSDGSPYGLACLMHFSEQGNDPYICKSADSELDRDNCYMNYSIATGNYSACDLIINSILDTQCRIETAMGHGELPACNKLGYSSRTNCYNLVLTGKIPIKGKESCLSLNKLDADPWEYRCLSLYAWQERDKSICDEINSTKYKSECEFRFS